MFYKANGPLFLLGWKAQREPGGHVLGQMTVDLSSLYTSKEKTRELNLPDPISSPLQSLASGLVAKHY